MNLNRDNARGNACSNARENARENNELIVIGCSAAGALAARDASRLGVRTLVLEEHSRSGKQGKCSGLVSRRGLRFLDADFEKTVLNEVRGARFHSKNNWVFSVERRSPVACVLDRQRFDEALARQAKAVGAEILLKRRVTAVTQNADGVAVHCGAKRFQASYLVAADGATSFTASALGFPKIPRFVLGYEAEFEGAKLETTDFVELFFDARVFPGFFAWLIPAGGRRVRAGFGTCDSKNFAYSKNAFHRLPAVEAVTRSRRAKRVREYAHVIPASVRPKTQSDGGRVLLAGDSAGQTKATTGGGIVFGGLCAREAASSIKKSLDFGAPPDYERAWRRRYGGVLASHSLLRRSLDFLGDEGTSALIGLGRRAGLDWFLREFGDMDFVFK